jgi:hypothetical protein
MGLARQLADRVLLPCHFGRAIACWRRSQSSCCPNRKRVDFYVAQIPLGGCAHIGTRDGLKGSAPLGREYLLENWELNKNIYGNGIIKVQLGSLLTSAKSPTPEHSSARTGGSSIPARRSRSASLASGWSSPTERTFAPATTPSISTRLNRLRWCQEPITRYNFRRRKDRRN